MLAIVYVPVMNVGARAKVLVDKNGRLKRLSQTSLPMVQPHLAQAQQILSPTQGRKARATVGWRIKEKGLNVCFHICEIIRIQNWKWK